MSQRQAAEAMHNSLAADGGRHKSQAFRPPVLELKGWFQAEEFGRVGSEPHTIIEKFQACITGKALQVEAASKVGKESMVPKLVARSGNVVIVLELVSISGKLSDVLRRSNAMPSYWQASLPIMTDSFKWHENVCWQGELGCRVVVVCELSSSWMPMSSIMGADEVWRTPVGPAAKSSAGLSP
eukprot:CAMPEP_0115278064 /NCGR_PEP_ID=MMETSP0270-20121206/57565_1 /TAXON_ID=71861 /ORGANISM="Scrippsiella trochoidea, Strain CCMP3099" /LENGTH=182 /DNA_ID=CAMNT_0002694729 /DNA_START=810 /DNA_END=1360 /DNA_ORIENTATION=+